MANLAFGGQKWRLGQKNGKSGVLDPFPEGPEIPGNPGSRGIPRGAKKVLFFVDSPTGKFPIKTKHARYCRGTWGQKVVWHRDFLPRGGCRGQKKGTFSVCSPTVLFIFWTPFFRGGAKKVHFLTIPRGFLQLFGQKGLGHGRSFARKVALISGLRVRRGNPGLGRKSGIFCSGQQKSASEGKKMVFLPQNGKSGVLRPKQAF